MKKYRNTILLGLAAFFMTFHVSSAQKWNASMQNLQKTLSELEPFLFNLKEFNNPDKQTFLREKFQQLAEESKNINHNPTLVSKDPTVRFVASRFQSDLERAEEAFSSGKTDFARYQLMKVTSSCIQCHTRMQQGPSFSFKKSESFFDLMSPSEQAEYLIASRRFDQAFDLILKNIKNAKEGNPTNWQVENMAGLAMIVAVQYQQDQKKALKVVEALEENESTPIYLRAKAQEWKRSLNAWKEEKKKPRSFAELRKLLEKKVSEVDAMRVIPEVLDYLEGDLPPAAQGEALLLAGEAYEVLNDVSIMDLHENYYESCILNAPHTPVAKKCYKKLESSVYLGYTGSGGKHVPADVEIWLSKLKKQ